MFLMLTVVIVGLQCEREMGHMVIGGDTASDYYEPVHLCARKRKFFINSS